jgi:UDP-N-acetylmuramate dehydrogenase
MGEKLSDIGVLAKSVPLEANILRFDVPATSLTTFGLGAPLPVVFTPKSLADLQRVWAEFYERKMPFKVLGAGSNILMPDEPLEYAVLQIGRGIDGVRSVPADSILSATKLMLDSDGLSAWDKFKHLALGEECRVYALAGTPLMRLSRDAARAGLSGLEFCSGIPASVGGAVRMNAGAHGPSMSTVVEAAVCLHQDGTPEVLDNNQLGFGYRTSVINDELLLVGVVLRLKKKTVEEVSLLRRESLDYRKSTQPLQYPSAGSIFKNPCKSTDPNDGESELKAGRLLEQAGVKGLRSGGVSFSLVHANWLVRDGGEAKTKNALELIEQARQRVYDSFGVELELEIHLW